MIFDFFLIIITFAFVVSVLIVKGSSIRIFKIEELINPIHGGSFWG